MMWLERAERIRTQQRNDKNKLYALHAPEVECIGKGKARKPYEFGVKSAVVVSHKHGLMLGARTFLGNPYDGHILSAVLEPADESDARPCGPAQTNRRRLGISRCRRRQPRCADHPPGQVQIDDVATKALAAPTSSCRTGDRTLEVRQPHGPLLVARGTGRCTARHQLCGGLQPALAAAGDRPSGPWATLFAPVAGRVVAGTHLCVDVRAVWPSASLRLIAADLNSKRSPAAP